MTAVCFTIATQNSPVVKSVAITFGDRGKINDTRKNGNNRTTKMKLERRLKKINVRRKVKDNMDGSESRLTQVKKGKRDGLEELSWERR